MTVAYRDHMHSNEPVHDLAARLIAAIAALVSAR